MIVTSAIFLLHSFVYTRGPWLSISKRILKLLYIDIAFLNVFQVQF